MTNYDCLLDKLRALGMDYRWAGMFVKKLKDDEIAFNASDDVKKWAMERGFFPGRVELYGLTDDNYTDYIPDFQYFMLHPMNNHFLKWLDKTTLKYVLNSNGCEDTMPEYYLYIENEKCGKAYTYLMDCPNDIPKDENFLWNLLQQKKILIMKPNSGSSGGVGVVKMELRGDDVYENNKLINRSRFEEIKDGMSNYIITEYVHQHHELAEVWPDSECTLRVIMIKNPRNNQFMPATWSCAVSYARFGTSKNGGASNLSSGGVGVGFDFETGRYNDFAIRYKKYTNDGKWKITKHPDTQYKWEGKILPNWNFVHKKILEICNHISSLDYLGFDIIITENGMKLCEINSHPAMDYEQVMCGPTLKKEAGGAYIKKGIFEQQPSAFYQAYLDSQN